MTTITPTPASVVATNPLGNRQLVANEPIDAGLAVSVDTSAVNCDLIDPTDVNKVNPAGIAVNSADAAGQSVAVVSQGDISMPAGLPAKTLLFAGPGGTLVTEDELAATDAKIIMAVVKDAATITVKPWLAATVS